KLDVSTEVIDIAFDAIEYLEEMVNSIVEGGSGEKDITSLISRLEKVGDFSSEVEDKSAKGQSTMELDEYQTTVVKQAGEQGFYIYQVNVELIEDCMLKAARVFMVFEVLEGLGEIVKANPTVEKLEEEAFEQSFSLVFLSKETAKNIENHIHNVSEINDVKVSIFHVNEKTTTKKGITNESDKDINQSKDEHNNKQSRTVPSKTIRVNMERIDGLMNLFEEIIIGRGRLEQLARDLESSELTETVEHITRASSDMQSLILSMRMVPVEQVFNRFPRMVRGLAKDLNKKVNLEIIGADTELDRTVIDESGDPLVHLIRNSADHGIESPERRLNNGKPEEGILILRAYHSGNHVFIEVEDDGAGIKRDKVVHKAMENGLIDSEQSENQKDHEVHQLILSKGYRTTDRITNSF